jgi:hypothetical protein
MPTMQRAAAQSFARRIDGANKVVVIEPPAPMQSSSTW